MTTIATWCNTNLDPDEFLSEKLFKLNTSINCSHKKLLGIIVTFLGKAKTPIKWEKKKTPQTTYYLSVNNMWVHSNFIQHVDTIFFLEFIKAISLNVIFVLKCHFVLHYLWVGGTVCSWPWASLVKHELYSSVYFSKHLSAVTNTFSCIVIRFSFFNNSRPQNESGTLLETRWKHIIWNILENA